MDAGEHTECRFTPADLVHPKPVSLEQRTELVERVEAHGIVPIVLLPAVAGHSAFHPKPRRLIVEVGLFHAHRAVDFEPHLIRLRADHEVTIDDLEQQHAVRAERAVKLANRALVLLFAEVAEARSPAEQRVERLFEGDVPHVATNEVALQTAVLGFVVGA